VVADEFPQPLYLFANGHVIMPPQEQKPSANNANLHESFLIRGDSLAYADTP